MSPPEKRWAGVSPDAEPHHQQPADTDQAQDIAPVGPVVYSRQVNWWEVHTFAAPISAAVDSWPLIGTKQWCELSDDDPRKIAAIFDSAQHWALRIETCQQAYADAGAEISAAAPWSRIAQYLRAEREFYAAHPWMKREVS
jgi:hypothetical protein